MTGPRMAEAEWGRRVLVLVGHGSSNHPEGARSVEGLVRALDARRIFADVRGAFLKTRPFLTDVLDSLGGRTAYVVPHLAADGVVGGEALPRSLAGRKGVVVCKATGTHPDVAEIAAARVAELRAAFALDPARLGVLVAGHGTPRNPESAARARALAGVLRAARAADESEAAFIEEPPLIGDWDRLLASPDVAVVPLLMAEGRHGGEDIARLLGLDPDDPTLAFAEAGRSFAGPFTARGRRLWLMRPLGADPAFAEIVLARVAEADG
jgi:sirohydrochlorin ferrochelatase